MVDGISLHMLGHLFDPEEPGVRQGTGTGPHRPLPGGPRPWSSAAGRWERRSAGSRCCGSRGTGAVGRPHVASALVEAGVVADVDSAFTSDWLANGGRADVRKHELDPFEAVRLVRAAGGVPVFAHPGAVKRGRTVPDQARIADLAAWPGLGGLEVDPHRPRRGPTSGLGCADLAADLGPADDRFERLPRRAQDSPAGCLHHRSRGLPVPAGAGDRGQALHRVTRKPKPPCGYPYEQAT